MTIRDLSGASPEEVLELVFSQALAEIPVADLKDIRAKFELLREGWGAKILAEGSTDQMRRIVLSELHRITRMAGFGYFQMQARLDGPPSLQISGIRVDSAGNAVSFIPLRIWRAAGSYLACGNSDFAGVA